jgi:GT2 family glycosyltransferase
VLDVVVVSFNTKDVTLRCLQALAAAAPAAGTPVRCIVVDNASSDGTPEAIEARFSGVDLVHSATNLGYARAVNRGAAEGQGQWILILNTDVFARPDALGRLVEFARANPHHAAVTGLLVDVGTDDPQRGFVVRSFPTLPQQLALLFGLEQHWPTNPVSRRARMLDFDYGRTQDLEGQPAGACLLVPRRHFEAVGGFDEGFFFWFEDVDLLLRLRQRGPLAFVHDAVFEHVGGASWRKWQRSQVILSRYPSLLRFFAKHRPRSEQVVLRLAVGTLGALRTIGWLPLSRERALAYARVVVLSVRGA